MSSAAGAGTVVEQDRHVYVAPAALPACGRGAEEIREADVYAVHEGQAEALTHIHARQYSRACPVTEREPPIGAAARASRG